MTPPSFDRTTPARILIVEDEAIVALDLKAQLTERGYQVVGIAASGEDALRLAAEQRPDLVLMDVRLRGAMDGVAAAEALQRQRPLPVIYLTSYGDAQTVQRAARSAPFGYLTKPFDPQQLWAGIEVALYKSAAEAELAEQRARVRAAELAMKAQNELLSRVSHELRTPLNAILGFAELLQLRAPASADDLVASYSGHILQAGRHLLAMVDDVLALQGAGAAGAPARLERLPLDEAVRLCAQALVPLAARHGVDVEQRIVAGLRVRADRERLRQVLLKIGENAVKYNRPGGRVLWQAERLDSGRVRLCVSDTGPGMTPDQLARLFQPFERLGQERSGIPGTGLGLLVARALMLDMGGTIELHSEPGTGTSVLLEFGGGGPD